MILSIIKLLFLDLIKISIKNSGLSKNHSRLKKMFSKGIDRGYFLSNVSQGLSNKDSEVGWQLDEDCQLNFEYLRSASL